MGISLNGLTPAGTYPGLIKTGDNTAISGTPKVLSDGNGNNLPMEVSTAGVNLTGSPTVNSVAIANTTQVAAKQDTLVSGTNIKTINSTSILGSGNINVVTSPSGVSGAIQFSNGSAFASDAANLFWDDTNNRLGIGTNAPSTALDLRGSLNIRRDGTNFTMRLGNLGQDNCFIDASNNNTFYLVDATFSNSFALSNVGIGLGVSPIASTRVAIKGTGSTSATTSLLVQNSTGTQAFKVEDGGVVQIGLTSGINWTFSTNILSSSQYAYIAGSNGSILTNGNFSGGVFGNDNGGKVADGGIGTAQVASAVLEVSSTTRGFLPPRMTTTERNAIASPAAGLVVYDSTTNKLQCYNGSTWKDLF
jgi:hypothetical protein